MLAQVDEYLEMFVQEKEQQAGEVPWRSCAPSCCRDRYSELLGRASGYLGDLLRLCSGRRIAGGKGAIALTSQGNQGNPTSNQGNRVELGLESRPCAKSYLNSHLSESDRCEFQLRFT